MRERLLMDPQWRFHLGDFPVRKGNVQWAKGANFFHEPIDPEYDDSSWRVLDLPHDFVIEAPPVRDDSDVREDLFFPGDSEPRSYHMMHGFLRSGIGWYRKSFFVPKEDEGRRLWIEFDGVFRNSTAWLNRHYLGNHSSGYTGVRYGIDDLLNYGEWNTVVVRVDASEFEGWYYEGGGIYRHVWLIKTDKLAFAPDGLFISCDPVCASSATVEIRATVCNDHAAARTGKLVWALRDPAGKIAASATFGFDLPGEGAAAEFVQTMTIPAPALWSPESPSLYTLTATIETGGAACDVHDIRFGVREAKFDAERGFLLNGDRVPLKGACCHQDHAGAGVALPDRLQEFRIERLKEMGCNAYRVAHHPPSPELLDICDRLGMFVMVENRILGSSPEVLGQVESMVKLGRNHPSVILWSLANEENQLQGTEMGARIVETMRRHVRQFDRTRPVTLAMNGGWPGPACDVVDVQGCNYIGSGNMDEFHRRFPGKPVVYTESDGTMGTRGEYADDPALGVISARDTRMMPDGSLLTEANWLHCLERPFVAGTFIWTGFAYRGEPAPFYAWPNTGSHFGPMDDCGFAKDGFYYYRSIWSDQPVLHLFPHWNWPGHEGRPVTLWAYTNFDEVELFLNGKSCGRQTAKKAGHLEWTVPYAPGTLLARGYRNGRAEKEILVETTGAAVALRIVPDRRAIRADGEDVSVLRVEAVDDAGRVVPDVSPTIVLDISGDGKLIGTGNGNPSNHESDKTGVRSLFHGLAMAIVQAGRIGGAFHAGVRSAGLRPASCVVETTSCVPRPVVVSGGPPVIGRYDCSGLYPPVADIRSVQLPSAGVKYRQVDTFSPYGLCDVRTFHSGKDGLLYLRVCADCSQAGKGSLAFGADGPVKVWVNGIEVACQPDATNPARKREYRARTNWQAGLNEIVFALATNSGRAWGVYLESKMS